MNRMLLFAFALGLGYLNVCSQNIVQEATFIADSLDEDFEHIKAIPFREKALKSNSDTSKNELLTFYLAFSKVGKLINTDRNIEEGIPKLDSLIQVFESKFHSTKDARTYYFQYYYNKITAGKVDSTALAYAIKCVKAYEDPTVAINDSLDYVGAIALQAYLENQFEDYEGALKTNKKAIKISESLSKKNFAKIASYYNQSGKILKTLGLLNQALTMFEKAYDYYQKTDQPEITSRQSVYNNLNALYVTVGDFQKAELLLKDSEKDYRTYEKEYTKSYELYDQAPQNFIEILSNASYLYRTKQDETNLLKTLDRLDSMAKTTQKPVDHLIIADSYNTASNYFGNQDKFETALYYIYQAEKELVNNPYSPYLIDQVLKTKSEVFFRAGRFEEAEAIINQQLKTPSKFFSAYYHNSQLSNKIHLLFRQRKTDSVILLSNLLLNRIHTGKDSLNVSTFKQEEFKADQVMGHANLLAEDLGNVFQKMDSVFPGNNYDHIAFNLNLTALKQFESNYTYTIKNELVRDLSTTLNNALLSSSYLLNNPTNREISQVIAAIENTRARKIYSSFIKKKYHAQFLLPDSLQLQLNQLEKKLNTLSELKTPTESDQKKLFKTQREINEINKLASLKYPEYKSILSGALDLKKIQSSLEPEELIIYLVVAKGVCYRFLIDTNNVAFLPLKSYQSIISTLQNLTDAVASKSTAYKKITDTAGALFFEDIDLSSYQKLTIIPSSELQQIPFEILTLKGDLLLQQHNVRYATTLMLLQEQMEGSSFKDKSGIVVFAPTYDKSQQVAFADLENEALRSGYYYLEGAQRESNLLEDLYNAKVFSNPNASKENFLKEADDYRILHLAMHAIANGNDDNDSFLLFGNNPTTDAIYASDLYNLTLNNDLVVLSACSTGTGSQMDDEGISSFSRAFTHAGTYATVASLWDVPDSSTELIMTKFYHYLNEGYDKSAALQQSKLDYLAKVDDEVLKHPFYWSGFVLYGNDDPILFDNDKSMTYVIYGLAAVILFILIVYLVKRRNKLKV